MHSHGMSAIVKATLLTKFSVLEALLKLMPFQILAEPHHQQTFLLQIVLLPQQV